MPQYSKLFITAKAGKNALDLDKLWMEIKQISKECFPEPVEIISQGKQNNPSSEKYMGYIRARFVVCANQNNSNCIADALVVFQRNTELENIGDQIICSITSEQQDFKDFFLKGLVKKLVSEYNAYYTPEYGVSPVKELTAQDFQL